MKGKWTELGKFPALKKHLGDKPIRMNRWIGLKGKDKHRIKDAEKIITKALSNPAFVAPYAGNPDVVNVYAKVKRQDGSDKMYRVGINKKRGEVTTVHPITQSPFDEARKNALE